MDVTGKVAFVTGGGSGVGLGMTKAFLAGGLKVAAVDVREDRLERLKDSLEEYGDDLLTLIADVTQYEEVERAADATEEHFGKVHIACNNAGIGVGGPIPHVAMDTWQRIINVNLWGVIHGCQVFPTRIQKHGEGGHIVNTASIMGLFSSGGSGPYCTTKFAVVGLSECMRQDLRETNIGISVLCPFVVDTPIFYPDLDDLDFEGIERRKKAMGLLRNALEPVAMGELVLQGIANNEPYIFSEGVTSRTMIESRVTAMNEALDRQFPQ